MEFTYIFSILSFIAYLITWVVFFIAANNIAKIKQLIAGSGIVRNDYDYWIAEYEKHHYWKRNEKALFALQEAIWYGIYDQGEDKRKDTYNELKEKFEQTIIDLGGEFLEYPV